MEKILVYLRAKGKKKAEKNQHKQIGKICLKESFMTKFFDTGKR